MFNSNVKKLLKQEHDIPTYVPPVRRIIAIGDLHGDYKATILSLRLAGIINKQNHWIGGKTTVVQLGDQIDRGGRGINYHDESSELRIIELFDRLAEEAKTSGGACYSLIGNHEMMNVQGDMSFVSPKGLQQFGGRSGRRKFFKSGGTMAQHLARTRNVVMKIGDFVFIHGGISPRILSKYRLEDINQMMREYMHGGRDEKDQCIHELFCCETGVLWCRQFSNVQTNCQKLRECLGKMRARALVIANTPQDNINCKCNASVWRVDTGMSEAFGPRKDMSRIQVLEILNNGEKINILQAGSG
jgi:hypothetical protein